MKIVIDIDDEQVLFDIKNRGLEGESETDKVIINALYNGKSLPKGHGRLIDADALDITTITTDDYSGNEILDVILKEDIDDASTIIGASNESEVDE